MSRGLPKQVAQKRERQMSSGRQLRCGSCPPGVHGGLSFNFERWVNCNLHVRVYRERCGRERRASHAKVAAPGPGQIPRSDFPDEAVGGNEDARSREAFLPDFAYTGEPNLPSVAHSVASTARNGRDDAYLVPRLERRLQAVQKANVLLANVDVDEAAHAFFVEQTFPQTRVLALEVVDHLSHGASARGHLVRATCQCSKWRRNAHDRFHSSLVSSQPAHAGEA